MELANGNVADVKDSPEFRARLQDEVAQLVKNVDWKARQPGTELVPWMKRFTVAALIACGLCFVPRLHFAGFLARAALPFANLERPSSVKITVETPLENSTLAPIASEVDVSVRVDGEPVSFAEIEYGELTASLRRMELAKVGDTRFEGKVPVGQSDVRFRVRALDGLSPWYTLEARARPRLVSFDKTIVPPAYAGGKEIKVTEDHGDIEALDGSTVKLTLKSNQPVAEAEVILNPYMPTHPGAPKTTIQADASVVSTDLVLDGKAEAWAMRLVSIETGITNEESASWRITILPDLPPVVTMTEPVEPQISLLSDETLRLAGVSSDDVGLASVELQHSLNGGNWTSKTLADKPGKESTVEYPFSLQALQVKPGDTIQIKLLATDLKGQKAESAMLRLIVLEQTVDPKRRVWAAEQRRLADMSKELSERARDLTKASSEVQKIIKKSQKQPQQANDEAETKLARLKQQLERTQEQADELWTQLKKAAQSAPTAVDAEETKQLGERLAQMRQSALRHLAEATDADIETPEMIKRLASEAYSSAATIAEASKSFAADDTAQLARQVAQQAARQQAQLKEQSLQANRDAAQRGKWQEQQRAAIAANDDLKNDLDELKTQVHGGHQNQIEQMQKQVAEAARDLADALDKPDAPPPPAPPQTVTPQTKSPEHLYGAADNLGQRLQRTAETVKNIAEDASRRAADMRQRLQQTDNPALVALDQAQAELATAAAKAKNPPKKDKPAKDGMTEDQRAQQKLADAARQLQDQAELKEQNPLTNTTNALDTNRASRAADKLARELTDAAADAPKLEATRNQAMDLAKIARTLEADALATEAKKAIDEAAARNTIATASQRGSEEPQQAAEAAQQAAEQLKQLPQALRRTPEGNKDQPLQQVAQQAADQARNAAQVLKDQARQAEQRPPAGQAQPPAPPPPGSLADAQMKAAQVAEALAPQAKAARDQLQALAPKVSDMMKQVAQDLNQTKGKTQDAAKQAEAQKPVAEVAEQAKQIQPEAAQNAEQMASLQAALRQEANAAQLADENQRQLARTADVALEQMRQKSPQIAQNLKQATQAAASQPQAEALNKAAQAQQATADALDQLAENFSKMEAGQPVSQESLAELAKMEEQLNVKEPLDEAYKAAQELAKIAEAAKKAPEAALAALEEKLKTNQPMQKALAEIAQKAAQGAEQTLAEKANQPSFLGDAAEEAGHEVARVARHQMRLQQEDAAKQSAAASEKLNATAKATKTQPGNATPEVAKAAQDAAKTATKSADDTLAKAPDNANVEALAQAEANDLAKALDQLDQALHPLGAPTQADAGQQKQQQQQSGQQDAQQSMASAQQNQQQSMAQARAQGKVPGQSQQQQQTAQNSKQQKNDPNGQQSKEGGNFSKLVKADDGTLVPIQVVVDADWGKLPAKMAEDLTEATRQEAAPEYRAAIENYYKAISAKSKK